MVLNFLASALKPVDMDKLSSEVVHAIDWLASEYKYLDELKDELPYIKIGEKDTKKHIKKTLSLLRYVGQSERRADRFEKKIGKKLHQLEFELSRNFGQAVYIKKRITAVREIIKHFEIQEANLIKYASIYQGSLSKEFNHLKAEEAVYEKIKEKNPQKADQIHQSFMEILHTVGSQTKELEKWVVASQTTLRKADMFIREYHDKVNIEENHLLKEGYAILEKYHFTTYCHDEKYTKFLCSQVHELKNIVKLHGKGAEFVIKEVLSQLGDYIKQDEFILRRYLHQLNRVPKIAGKDSGKLLKSGLLQTVKLYNSLEEFKFSKIINTILMVYKECPKNYEQIFHYGFEGMKRFIDGGLITKEELIKSLIKFGKVPKINLEKTRSDFYYHGEWIKEGKLSFEQIVSLSITLNEQKINNVSYVTNKFNHIKPLINRIFSSQELVDVTVKIANECGKKSLDLFLYNLPRLNMAFSYKMINLNQLFYVIRSFHKSCEKDKEYLYERVFLRLMYPRKNGFNIFKITNLIVMANQKLGIYSKSFFMAFNHGFEYYLADHQNELDFFFKKSIELSKSYGKKSDDLFDDYYSYAATFIHKNISLTQIFELFELIRTDVKNEYHIPLLKKVNTIQRYIGNEIHSIEKAFELLVFVYNRCKKNHDDFFTCLEINKGSGFEFSENNFAFLAKMINETGKNVIKVYEFCLIKTLSSFRLNKLEYSDIVDFTINLYPYCFKIDFKTKETDYIIAQSMPLLYNKKMSCDKFASDLGELIVKLSKRKLISIDLLKKLYPRYFLQVFMGNMKFNQLYSKIIESSEFSLRLSKKMKSADNTVQGLRRRKVYCVHVTNAYGDEIGFGSEKRDDNVKNILNCLKFQGSNKLQLASSIFEVGGTKSVVKIRQNVCGVLFNYGTLNEIYRRDAWTARFQATEKSEYSYLTANKRIVERKAAKSPKFKSRMYMKDFLKNILAEEALFGGGYNEVIAKMYFIDGFFYYKGTEMSEIMKLVQISKQESGKKGLNPEYPYRSNNKVEKTVVRNYPVYRLDGHNRFHLVFDPEKPDDLSNLK